MKSSGKLVVTKYNKCILSLLYDKNNNVEQILIDGGKHQSILGNIYIGRVSIIHPNLNAAFVEYSPGQMGYFPIDENPDPIYIDLERPAGPLKNGDVILVQVSKDSIKSKEPVLTSRIDLAGKYVVLSLSLEGVHFSAKFKDPAKKAEITGKINSCGFKGFGFILRTNAATASLDSIMDEIDFLSKLWLTLRDYSAFKTVFSLIYPAPKSYITSIRDGYDHMVGEIITDCEDIFYELNEYLSVYQPDDIGKLSLYNNKVVTLKVLYNVEKQLEDALKPKVWLPSGGYIVIQPTEALVSIDVNTGKYVSKRDAQKEFLKINMEAAAEIARQMRLRNLSGIIIVDFISMKSKETKEELLKHLQKLLNQDPVKTTLVEMTKLNLVEITRKKARRPLYELIDI